MAIVQDNPQAILNEVNGLLDKRNIKKGSLSGDRLEDGTIGSTQITDGTISRVDLNYFLKRELGILAAENSQAYFIDGTTFTSAMDWSRGGISMGIYWDGTQWVNPAVGSNVWGAIMVGNTNIRIFGERSSGNVQRTYTEAAFLATEKAVINLSNGRYENRVNDYQRFTDTHVFGGGTTVFVNGWGVNWNARFICIAMGRNAATSTSGYFDITKPPDGTAINVHGGAAARNMGSVVAGFLNVTSWESLWYELPLGSGATSQNANFHVVGYTSDFDIPPNWVLLFQQNGDDNSGWFNNGTRWGKSDIYDAMLISPNNAKYKTVSQTSTTFPVIAANTFWPTQSGTWISSGGSASGNQGIFYFKETDYNVPGLTTRCRFLVEIGCNATAPFGGASTFTFGLKTVSNFTGGAGVVGVALGATITGSTCVFTQPAANTGYESSATSAVVTTASADFNMPATGLVIPFCTTSAATAANSFEQVTTFLQVRNT